MRKWAEIIAPLIGFVVIGFVAYGLAFLLAWLVAR